jgi:hypothetical protein
VNACGRTGSATPAEDHAAASIDMLHCCECRGLRVRHGDGRAHSKRRYTLERCRKSKSGRCWKGGSRGDDVAEGHWRRERLMFANSHMTLHVGLNGKSSHAILAEMICAVPNRVVIRCWDWRQRAGQVRRKRWSESNQISGFIARLDKIWLI